MNNTYQRAFDAIMASETLVTYLNAGELASLPLAWGTDIACYQDADENFSEVDEFSVEAIGQAIIRRLITPRGALLGSSLKGSADKDKAAADYGLGLVQRLNKATDQRKLRDTQSDAEKECMKDDRVSSVICQAGFTAPTKTLTVSLRVTPVSPLQPFDLVFQVNGSEVLITKLG
jgi:hypothetical protein